MLSQSKTGHTAKGPCRVIAKSGAEDMTDLAIPMCGLQVPEGQLGKFAGKRRRATISGVLEAKPLDRERGLRFLKRTEVFIKDTKEQERQEQREHLLSC